MTAMGQSAKKPRPVRHVSLIADRRHAALKEHHGLNVLMAEQNFSQAMRIADRGYVIVHGKIAFEGRSTEELSNNELIRQFYLGA